MYIDISGFDNSVVCRLYVVCDVGVYRMWFCVCGVKYWIYCVILEDGLIWW